MSRTTFSQWFANLPIPWMVAGPNGQQEANGWPAVIDAQTVLLDAARKVAFPDFAPTDALGSLGGDRGLIQGPLEGNSNFIARLKNPWTQWSYAGTHLELLEQLYWAYFNGAVIVQQNGLAFSLSGAPTAGADNSGLLSITTLGTLASPLTPYPLYSTSNPIGYTKTIPSGSPWWTFDSKTDFCSRFAVIFPAGAGGAFTTSATATFTASATAAITWNNVFPDTTYIIDIGAITITSGGPVTVSYDPTTKTTTGVTLTASAAFTGSVDVIAYQVGAVSPFADIHPADLGRLQTIIKRWRRASQTCVGVYVIVQGNMWGWPVRTWGSGGTWGAAQVVTINGTWQ